MNTDKAYIMGLVVGGGCFSSNHQSFYIKLPYRKWGDAKKNPERAGLIATDIIKVVKPLMKTEYNLDVSYTTGREWRIVCYGDIASLVSDLRKYGIEPSAELHKTADLSLLINSLTDTHMKKRFIAGVADTIGSLTESHRRFSESVQIISFEISGFNYKYVCQLCNLLYQIGCMPDQILWQHPNMHSGRDSYYSQWKKGNKLRVKLDAYSEFGSLAFKSKALASKDNMVKESGRYNAAEKCEVKELSASGVVSVHIDENHSSIPNEIRGGHYIHHKQICAALNCPHAPKSRIDRVLMDAENYISPFAVLHKDDAIKVERLVKNDPIMNNRSYQTVELHVQDLVSASKNGHKTVIYEKNSLRYSKNREKGYPLNIMLDALAYIIASKTGRLSGKRPPGKRDEIIRNALKDNPNFTVTLKIPDLLTPVIITDGKVSAMVGPLNASVYRKLISYADDNKYKMIVRKITEEDLRE